MIAVFYFGHLSCHYADCGSLRLLLAVMQRRPAFAIVRVVSPIGILRVASGRHNLRLQVQREAGYSRNIFSIDLFTRSRDCF